MEYYVKGKITINLCADSYEEAEETLDEILSNLDSDIEIDLDDIEKVEMDYDEIRKERLLQD